MKEREINLEYIHKAQTVFERVRKDLSSEAEKMGAVQAFEICYELSWKLMKRVLAARGVETGSPKDTFRRAAQEKIIEDPELWFSFQKMRNLSVHTYNLDTLNEVIESLDKFSAALQELISKIESMV